MAPCVCYVHDADTGSYNHSLGWSKKDEDDGQNLSKSHPADWLLLQPEPDLWQQSLSISQRGVHSDVEGRVLGNAG